MSSLEVITASTLHTAEYLGSSSRIGSIEACKLADLVVVKRDPSVDIRNMYDIQKVMLNGLWIGELNPKLYPMHAEVQPNSK